MKNSIEKIEEFGVDMGELVFLCEDLSKARIKSYPIIIFEFTEGYYITKNMYINNTHNYQLFEAFNTYSNIGGGINNNTKLTDIKKSILSFPKLSSSIYKKDIKFSSLNEKFKQFEFFYNQTSIYNENKIEKIQQLNNQLKIMQDAYLKYYNKYEKIINIGRMRKQIVHITEKIESFDNTINEIKKIISQKQSDLHISSSIYSLNRENYKENIKRIDKNLKRIEKCKIVYNAFKNKKLAELTYFFFNKFCYKFYIIPSFYSQKFDIINKVLRFQYYDKNSKELSVMMGIISSIINYLSKLFNIPLKYPLFINGSRSYLVKDKKE